jgi:hypothetical protein
VRQQIEAKFTVPMLEWAYFAGVICGAVYTYIFAKHTTQDMTKMFLASTVVIVGCLSVAGLFEVGVAANAIGLVGCCLAVTLMASPLAVLATVVRERSTKSMPFLVSLATFL